MAEIIKYENGGIRESAAGKGTYKYVPTVALKRVSHRYQYGEMKYGATDNFKKGLPVSNCWDSAMRHLIEYMEGDNKEDHLAAVVWNVFCIMEMEKNHPEMVDIESRAGKKSSPEYYRDKALQMLQKGAMK